jgi:hypothetical protein
MTVQEIEKAIRALPPKDKEKLIHNLPSLFPELKGDASWHKILSDPTSRPSLTALLNEVDAEYEKDSN